MAKDNDIVQNKPAPQPEVQSQEPTEEDVQQLGGSPRAGVTAVSGEQQPGQERIIGGWWRNFVDYAKWKAVGYDAKGVGEEYYAGLAEKFNRQTESIKDAINNIASEELKFELGDAAQAAINNNLEAAGKIQSATARAVMQSDPSNPIPMLMSIMDDKKAPAGNQIQNVQAPELPQYSTDPVKNQAIIGIASNLIGTIGGAITGQFAEGVAAGAAGSEAAAGVADRTRQQIAAMNQANNKMLADFATQKIVSSEKFATKYLEEVGKDQRKLLDEINQVYMDRRQNQIDIEKAKTQRQKVQIDALTRSGNLTEQQAEREKLFLDQKQKNLDIENERNKEVMKTNARGKIAAMRISARMLTQYKNYMLKQTNGMASDLSAIQGVDPTVSSFAPYYKDRISSEAMSSGLSPASVRERATSKGNRFNDQIRNMNSIANKDWLLDNKDKLGIIGSDKDITSIEVVRNSVAGMASLANFIATANSNGIGIMVDDLNVQDPFEMVDKFANLQRNFNVSRTESGELRVEDTINFLNRNGFTFRYVDSDIIGLTQAANIYEYANGVENELNWVADKRAEKEVKVSEVSASAFAKGVTGEVVKVLKDRGDIERIAEDAATNLE